MEGESAAALKRDFVAGVVLVLLAAVYGIGAGRIPESALIGRGIGAGSVPTGIAVALGGFALILMLRAALRLKRLSPAPETQPSSSPADPRQRHPHLRAFGMLAIGAGFIALLGFLGYALAVALLLGATAYYNGMRRLVPLVLFAVGGGIVCHLVFVTLLGIPLPAGVWPSLFPSWLGD